VVRAGPRRRPRPGRYTRLRASVGRHPADLIRLGTAAAIVLLCLLIARAHGVNPVESAVFAELEQLPAWSTRTWQVLTWFGSWPGIAAAGFALYLGRLRLATSLVAAGTTSWVLATILHWLTAPRLVPPGLATTLLRQPPLGGFDFPSGHAAVIAALVTAASPYLLVGAADVYLGPITCRWARSRGPHSDGEPAPWATWSSARRDAGRRSRRSGWRWMRSAYLEQRSRPWAVAGCARTSTTSPPLPASDCT